MGTNTRNKAFSKIMFLQDEKRNKLFTKFILKPFYLAEESNGDSS